MRAIYATIFLLMFLLNVAWGQDGYTEVDSDDLTPAERETIKDIIQQKCPPRRSQCYAKGMARDVKRRVENAFSGSWSVIVRQLNTKYSSYVSNYKFFVAHYKGLAWTIFQK